MSSLKRKETDLVKKVIDQIEHKLLYNEKAILALYNAYLEELDNGACLRLDALEKNDCTLSRYEKEALERLYHSYIIEYGEMQYMREKDRKWAKKIVNILNNALDEKTEKSNEAENSKELCDKKTEEINKDREEVIKDSPEVSALKAKNEELENKLRLVRDELEKMNKKNEEALKQAEDTVNKYLKMIRDFDDEKERQKKAWYDRCELECEQKRIETEAQLAAYNCEVRKRVKAEAEAERKKLLEEGIKDYIDGMRNDWRSSHAELSDISEAMAMNISRAKAEACDESSRIQREMKEAIDKHKEFLNNYTIQFCSGLDSWRSSVFSIQLKAFAEWYSRFCGFVDRFDSRFVKDMSKDELEEVAKIGASLTNLRNSLERALPSMGLNSYYPLAGDEYNPVYHEANEEFVESGATIKTCTKPGVELISSNEDLRRVLIKAEVDVEVK